MVSRANGSDYSVSASEKLTNHNATVTNAEDIAIDIYNSGGNRRSYTSRHPAEDLSPFEGKRHNSDNNLVSSTIL